ncbi:hypothetical protein OU5_1130 [Pseudomonas mandelii JR-1]|uniref:Uncharacterized protein n=1 Tax=Pseudomonas mandelii JR-1 TaxID=1147786 RepID=A0A024E5K6_9PSED|nr:hypothetical protein OU5_1130 [Pseudomonas mandelii JR-1]
MSSILVFIFIKNVVMADRGRHVGVDQRCNEPAAYGVKV